MQDELTEALVRAGRKKRLWTPADDHRAELGVRAIEELIPHRDPFRFVDRIDAIDRAGGFIAGRRHVDPADPLFRGHFPGDPIYPGVLQLEALGQLGLCLFALSRTAGGHRGGVRALKIHHAAFLAPIRPGAEMHLLGQALSSDDYTGVCAGQVIVEDVIACIAVMEVYFVEA